MLSLFSLCQLDLRSYISDRTFYIRVENDYSEINGISADVPRNSVLGPVLFTIFMADITKIDTIFCGYVCRQYSHNRNEPTPYDGIKNPAKALKRA